MLMTISEFATASGLSARQLRRLHETGEVVPIVTKGGHRRYEEAQIDEASRYVKEMRLLSGGKNVIADMEDFEEFFAYLLGLIFADGTVSECGQVQLEMKDKQIIEDVAMRLGVNYYPRSDRSMWRLSVPRYMANRLVEYGVCRRKCEGFDIPDMSVKSFGLFLRGLFDGDGSVSVRGNGLVLRFHGHPRAMAHVQATLLGYYELYLPWVPDNRTESGMLETARRSTVEALRGIMYASEGVCLGRKREIIEFNKEDTTMGMG